MRGSRRTASSRSRRGTGTPAGRDARNGQAPGHPRALPRPRRAGGAGADRLAGVPRSPRDHLRSHGAPRAPGARSAPRAARPRRPDLRAHAGHAVPRGPASIARTPHGAVRAGAAVVALNAWAQHWRRFRRGLTVRGTYIVLTAPAPERLDELGWTDGTGLWDTRASVHYVRTTPDGRIAFGIGGMQPDFARTIDRRYAYDAPSIRPRSDLHRMFPSFADVPVEAAWGGPIDVAARHVPAFTTVEPGTVHAGHGYTGNGVGPSHLGGADPRAPGARSRRGGARPTAGRPGAEAVPAGAVPQPRRVRGEPSDRAARRRPRRRPACEPVRRGRVPRPAGSTTTWAP